MAKLMRTEGWESRLAAFLQQEHWFEWGVRDCMMFAADAIEVLTEKDPCPNWRRRCDDEQSARSVLRQCKGFNAAIDMVMSECGFAEIEPLQAHRGDPVTASIAKRKTMGVCAGSQCAFLQLAGGLFFLPITAPSLLRAWRVP